MFTGYGIIEIIVLVNIIVSYLCRPSLFFETVDTIYIVHKQTKLHYLFLWMNSLIS